MADIQNLLKQILSSVYGKDVRQSIHDSIKQCYEDGKSGSVDLFAREKINIINERIDNCVGDTWIIVDDTKDLSTISFADNCVVYFKKGTYIDAQINLSGVFNVVLFLHEATINTKEEYFIVAENCDDIIILGGKIKGCSKCAVKLQNCKRPIVKHVEVFNIGSSSAEDTCGIQIFGDCSGFDVSNCYVHDITAGVVSSDGFVHAYGIQINRLGSTDQYSESGRILSCEIINIAGVDSSDVKADGDGIFIQIPPIQDENGSIAWRENVRITIDNCIIKQCKKRGIKLSAAGISVRNTLIDGEMWYAGIDCQYGHVEIDHCVVINSSDYNNSATSSIILSEGGVKIRNCTIKAQYGESSYHPGIRFNKRLPGSVVQDTIPWDAVYIDNCYFDKVSRAVYCYPELFTAI